MDTTEQERLYKRIKAVLALAESPNAHEAALAAERAADLIQKYNLDHDEVRDWSEPPDIGHETVYLYKLAPSIGRHQNWKWRVGQTEWFTTLVDAIAAVCGVRAPFFSTGSVTVIGDKENVKQATFLISNIYSRLLISAEKATKQYSQEYKEEHGVSPYRWGGWVHPNRWYEGWLDGAAYEIANRLHDTVRKAREQRTEQTKNAIVLTHNAIQKYMEDEFSHIKGAFVPSEVNSFIGFAAGHDAGKRFPIQQGIEKGSISIGQLNQGE